jgi:hypothetical protein
MVRKILAALAVALGVGVATPTIGQMPYGMGSWRYHVQFRSGRGWSWRHYAWTRSRRRAYRMATHLRVAGFQSRVLSRWWQGYGYGSSYASRGYYGNRRLYRGYAYRPYRGNGMLNPALAQTMRNMRTTAQGMQNLSQQQQQAVARRTPRVQSYVAAHGSAGQHAAVQRAARQMTRVATVARAPGHPSSGVSRVVAHANVARSRNSGGMGGMPHISVPRMPSFRPPTAGFHAAAQHAAMHYGGGGGHHGGGMGHVGGGGGGHHGGHR